MRRLADSRVVHVEIAADGAHNDLARVEPDPDLYVHAVRAARLLRVALHQILHPQRRIARPHGVVLVSEGRAEERHDPIAHDLVLRALVAVDGLHHSLEQRIEDLARLLGIAVGEELHRALHISEQHRDLLALALESGLRREDALSEVLGRVGIGRPEPLRGRGRPVDGMSTLRTEPRGGWELVAAAHAPRGERSGALEAELRLRRGLPLAPRAHSSPGAPPSPTP